MNFLPRLCLALALALQFTTQPAFGQGVRIHEFLASNDGGLQDEDGDDSDWIELWNSSASPVNLSGWRLTDDPADPAKWIFPNITLPPGAFRVIFASGKDRSVPGSILHTNFKLSSDGEYLALADAAGNPQTAFEPEYPVQESNRSYGFLDTPGSPAGFLDPPSPGGPNGDQFTGLAKVQASRARGIRLQPFPLELESPDPGATIHYTLDGSLPVPGSAIVYTGPIPINSTTILRAVASAANFTPSQPATFTYIYPTSVRTQSNASAAAKGNPSEWVESDGTEWSQGGMRPGASYVVDGSMLSGLSNQELAKVLRRIPTVSLVMPTDDWFGDGSSGVYGIYANSEEDTEPWRRQVSVEWIDPFGKDRWQVDCGINIQGGSSTIASQRNQLSMALVFQGEYGSPKLKKQLFGPGSAEEFDYLVLDAGNRHSINRLANLVEKAHAQELRDRFMMDLHGAMGTNVIHGRPVHVYLNGLYWGVYQLHERPDHHWSADYSGGEEEEYDWIKVGVVKAGNQTAPGSPTPSVWNEAVEIALGGVAPGDQWQGEPAFGALAKRLDLEAYADYLLLNYYGGNADWPGKNWMMTSHARNSADLADVHPNPVLQPRSWDAEAVLYWGGNELLVGDGFYDRTSVISETWSGSVVFFHTALRAHPEWSRIFGDRAHFHVFHPDGALYVAPGYDVPGTPYDSAHPERNRPASLYAGLAQSIEDVVLMEFARWGDYWYTPGTIQPANWLIERDRLLEDFFPVRSQVVIAQLRNAPVPLYPDLEAVQFSRSPGLLPAGTPIEMSAPAGASVYFTLDGRDPRLPGGSIDPSALQYSTPLVTPASGYLRIMARAYQAGAWSAAAEFVFRSGIDLAINEVQLANLSTVADPAGDYDDWIEVVNRSSSPVNLEGYMLSDSKEANGAWTFPAGTILPPDGYLLVFCDEDLGQPGLHTDFKLSATGGEQLLLRAPRGAGSVVLDRASLSGLGSDSSWARTPNARGRFQATDSPTPGAANPLREKQP